MSSDASSLVFLQYLSTVFDDIPDAILLVSAEPKDKHRLLLANKGFTQCTGYKEVAVGKSIKDIVEPEAYHRLAKLYNKVAKNKEPGWFVETITVPLGIQTYKIRLIPILNAVGECMQIAAIMQNVTELHDLRVKLAETSKTLEDLAKTLRRV
ncbi:MAG TPA: PAS domain-containing protein [Patescibacteria group bacterium]|nr:PAS domain-containing protein [Patescibacteria group bacterium]